MAQEIHLELQCEYEVLEKCCSGKMCGLGLEFRYQPGAGQSTEVTEKGVRVTSAMAL